MNSKLAYVKTLENNELFFEEKFNNLENYYILKSKSEVHDYINERRGIIVLLDEIKPYLNEFFQEAQYELSIEYDPEITEFIDLFLTVKVSGKRLINGHISDDFQIIRGELYPLKRKLNLSGELILIPGV